MEDLAYIVEPPQVSSIKEQTLRLGFGMPSEPLVGTLLRTLAASKPEGRFLELGTGTGIATAWLLAGMDTASTLISVDTDATVQTAAPNILGHDPRLKLLLSDGLEYLPSQKPGSFDLVFGDAMPGKDDGLEAALAVVRVGGFYVIDDMSPQPNWPEGHAAEVPALMEQLARR